MKLYGFLETNGRLLVVEWSRIVPNAVRPGSIVPAEAVTSTCVVVPAMWSVIFRVTVAPALTVMPVTRESAKPVWSKYSNALRDHDLL
jgi:hypothetical protein